MFTSKYFLDRLPLLSSFLSDSKSFDDFRRRLLGGSDNIKKRILYFESPECNGVL